MFLLFNKYLLGSYYIPSIVLGSQSLRLKQSPGTQGVYILEGTDNKYTNIYTYKLMCHRALFPCLVYLFISHSVEIAFLINLIQEKMFKKMI